MRQKQKTLQKNSGFLNQVSKIPFEHTEPKFRYKSIGRFSIDIENFHMILQNQALGKNNWNKKFKTLWWFLKDEF